MGQTDKGVVFEIAGKRFEITLLGIFTFFFFCRLSFLNFAKTFNVHFQLMVNTIVLIILAAAFLYTVTCIRNNICWDGLVLVAVMAIFFAITIYYHPEYQERYEDALHHGRFSAEAVFSFGSAIYAYYVIRLHKTDPDRLFDIFRVIPYFLMLLNFWTILFNKSDEYSMDFGYQMEMAAILFMAVYLHEKHRWHQLVLSLICIAAGVLYGSRACIIGYAVFIVAYVIWRHKMTIRQFIILALGFSAVGIYCSRTLMMWIFKAFSALGFRSRTLYLIASGNIMGGDTARQDKIWPVLIEELQRSSVFKIRGAYGGRYLLASNWSYEHNIILEILLTFGVVIGSILIIWITVSFIKTMVQERSYAGLLTLAFGCFSICRLMLSNTFWQEAYFWAFLAMLVNCSGSAAIQRRQREKSVLWKDAKEASA